MARLSSQEIEAQLDELLEVEFSFRDTATPAAVLGEQSAEIQQYILRWIARAASTHIEIGYQYACKALVALESMNQELVDEWVLYAMDAFDQKGLFAAVKVMSELDDFVRLNHERTYGCTLKDREGVLLGFLRGLSGRKLNIETSSELYTDTETVFLPSVIAAADDSEANFLLYKSALAMTWAQGRFGTFRVLLLEETKDLEEQQQADFIALFHAFETLRLEACVARELPGLYRALLLLKNTLDISGLSDAWASLAPLLENKEATEQDSLALCHEHFGQLVPYESFPHHGLINAQAVERVRSARIEKEKAIFRLSLKEMIDDNENVTTEKEETTPFSKKEIPDENHPDGGIYEIELEGEPMKLPENMAETLNSIIQDWGDIPPEYLEAAGDGEYDADFLDEEESSAEDVWGGAYHEEGAFLYDEWDFRREHFHKAWCAVREMTVEPVYDDFYQQTMKKHMGLVKHLRKTFEALRDDNRMLKRQSNGDDIDIDALVEALADANDGSEMSDRLFTRMNRTERNIAVVFMVDMSGSTKGWINDAERESLLLLCEALESLGDRYAIYGFSGTTRKRCELYHIKHFSEVYDDEIKARISGIRAKDYTRMGFAIRHLSKLLMEVEAKARILITLSDGKPDDYDSYRGVYGIEDTRKALMEARRDGIHPYCITIDEQASDYLPHLYGAAAYTVVSEVRELPLKVSDIYRRLTT